MPLALIVAGHGHRVAGSDRSLDQGRISAKFDWLRAQNIDLFPQDGSGVVSGDQIVVASAAVENSVPDLVVAAQLGCTRQSRAELLAELFNQAPMGIAVGGTSGKSTVTGMIGWIFHALGADPTIMNGAVMKNFVSPDAPFASALVGRGDSFISEVDESDGSIALYRPTIAVLNNIALDHKSMEELRQLFSGYIGRATKAVLNADNDEVMQIATPGAITYSLTGRPATLAATSIQERPDGVDFSVNGVSVSLQVPGRHNVANALAALGAAAAAGLSLDDAARVLGGFTGLRRRLEHVGTAGGVTVIDDFGHNPDKIAATLDALHSFPGRLLLFFQPHGYGPLRLMGEALAETFVSRMKPDDHLFLCDPVYFGGTVDRSVGSDHLARMIGAQAEHIAERERCGEALIVMARPGDRIIVMGARDDTLIQFAEAIVAGLEKQALAFIDE